MQMKIVVKYFAGLRDITGKESEILEIQGITRVSELLSYLMKRYPELKKASDIIVARNRAFVEEEAEVSENDEIALLPPVSGG
jgi:molybdopterin converting factor subunit 1